MSRKKKRKIPVKTVFLLGVLIGVVFAILVFSVAVNKGFSLAGDNLAGAQFLAGRIQPVSVCQDTDDGNDYYTKGTCSVRGNEFTDHCTSGGSGGWWDPEWEYRKRIGIQNTNPTDPVPAGYVIAITLDHGGLVSDGKSLLNGNDVRIIYADSVELDRVNVTSFGSLETVIHFTTKNPIPAGEYDDNYFVYYGNPSSGEPPANVDNIYLFHDDFDDGDISDWSQDAGSWYVSNGYVTTPDVDGRLSHISYFPDPNDGIQYWFDMLTTSSGGGIFSLSQSTSSASPGFWAFVSVLTRHQGGYNNICNTGLTVMSHRCYSLHVTKSEEGVWSLDVKGHTDSGYCSGTDSTNLGSSLFLTIYSANNPYAGWDNLRFARYMDPAPTANIGDEETGDNTLIEYSCSNDICIAAIFDCTNLDKICHDGVCIDPPTHTQCIDLHCALVPGQGEDECSADSDCPRHLECIIDTCTIVPGEGTNNCSPEGSFCGPDLTVSYLNVTEMESNQTDVSFTVDARIENIGIKIVAQTTTFFNFSFGDSSSIYTPPIYPGEHVDITSRSNAPPGNHSVTVYADFHDKRMESDENNNNLTLDFELEFFPPDLTVTDLKVIDMMNTSNSSIKSVTLEATIMNSGFYVFESIARFSISPGGEFQDKYVPDIEANQTFTVNVTFSLALGDHTAIAIADYYDDLVESDEDNNNMTLEFTV